MFQLIEHTLTASLATAGTATVSYPDGYSKGFFTMGARHKIIAAQAEYEAPRDFTLTFGDSNITLTWKASNTLASGTALLIQAEQPGEGPLFSSDPLIKGVVPCATKFDLVGINFGTPIAADADAFIKDATGTEIPDEAETVSYTFPVSSAASPQDGVSYDGLIDEQFGRNVTATVTHATSVVAMTITVTGEDLYGQEMVETLSITATGTSKSATGVKAFKKITQVDLTAAADASANTVQVGFGSVLGLPVYLPATALIVKELVDGAAAGTDGAFVAGAGNTAPTATTGDVRGTYAPNSAPNGGTEYELIIALADPGHAGTLQYAG